MARKKKIDDEKSALGLVLDENLHAEVQEILDKNIITDEDIEKYNMNKETSLSMNEFLGLVNKALDADIDGDKLVEEVVEELSE